LSLLKFPKLRWPMSLACDGGLESRPEQVRSAERNRRAAWSAAGSGISRGLGAAAGYVSVPLAIGYLGTERYGLWMAISSVLAMLNFADLGMGNGLLNAISAADATSNRQMAVRSVSSAFFILVAIAGCIATLAFALNPVLPWKSIFNITTPLAASEVAPSVLVFTLCVALNLPLGIVDKVQIGFQEGFANSLWQSASALLGLASVVAAIRFKCSLPLLVGAVAGAPTLVRAANWGVQFIAIRPWLRPSPQSFERSRAKNLTKTGMVFFTFSLLIILGSTSDSFIIAHFLGVPAVATYAVVQKLFSSTAVSEYLIPPLWPAFGEAIARRDFDWIRRTIRGSLSFNLPLTVVIGVVLVIFGRPLIAWWTATKILAPLPLLASFAVLRLLTVFQGTLSVFLNHGDTLRKQLVFFALASVCSLILKVVLIRHFRESGVVWATIGGFSVFYVWPAARLAVRSLRSLSGRDGAQESLVCG
jgi:O-antigen/teichoic acid export membrane protein